MFSMEQIESMMVEIECCILLVKENFIEFLKNRARIGPSLKWDNFFAVILQCTLLLSPVSGFFFLDILWTNSKMLIEEENSFFGALAFAALLLEQISLAISMIISYFKLSPMKVFVLQTIMLFLTCLSVSFLIESIIFQRSSHKIDNIMIFFLFWLTPIYQFFLCFKTSIVVMLTYHLFIAKPEASNLLANQEFVDKE